MKCPFGNNGSAKVDCAGASCAIWIEDEYGCALLLVAEKFLGRVGE